MRRGFKRLIAAALLIVALLFLTWGWWRAESLSSGPPLARGKVEPQLASAWDTAVLLAPDGVTNRVFPFTRIGNDSDWKNIYCGEQCFFAQKSDGSWWVCGQNRDGQLGLGARPDVLTIGAPQRWPYEFEPWAISLASDRGATVILLKDGTLWTCGIRLGEPKPSSRFDGFKRIANRYLQHVPGRPHFAIRQYQTDTVPRKFWSLPPNVANTASKSSTNN